MNDGGNKSICTAHTSIASNLHEGYKRILNTANKLEAIQSKVASVIDLFGTPLVGNLFGKLCNDCVHLLTKCDFKLEEFRKAEELVWRRAYHDVYRLLKTTQQVAGKHDEYMIESHFMAGIGHYSDLIVQLRIKYKIIEHVQGIVSPLGLALGPAEGLHDGQWLGQDGFRIGNPGPMELADEGQTSGSNLEAAQQWARQAIYRSLVYMGDLARYLIEFSHQDHRKLSFEMYKSASRYQPEQGLPFNQLAALAGGTNHNLDAICNYMRCCLRPKPFDRAEGNMVKLFELNRKHYDELAKDGQLIRASQVLACKDPGGKAEELMRLAIVTFLKLASDLWFAIGENLGTELQDTVVHETQSFFEILREAMELEPIVPFASDSCADVDFRPIAGNPSNLVGRQPRYVSPTIIYEFCSISIMLIARRQQKSAKILSPILSTLNENITDLTNTLALNLLHYATSKCQRMIISKIQELRLSRQQDSTLERSVAIMNPTSEQSLRNSSPISSDAASRRVMSRLRQKKAATTYVGSAGKQSRSGRAPDPDESDLSELEETALSTIDALDISSDMSDGLDDLINLDSSCSSRSSGSSGSGGTSHSGGHSDGGGSKINASARRNRLTRPALRPTRSQTYEQKGKSIGNALGSCNSLPMPDLLTGDLADISFRTNPTIYNNASETPSEFGSELRLGAPSTSESTLGYIYNQTYLPTIKVFFDWLLSNGPVIDSNIESFSSFQTELLKTVELLDELRLLLELKDSYESEHARSSQTESEILGHAFSGPEWIQRYPLSCDHAFVNLSPMKGVHESNIDFEYERELDEAESGFVTMQCIVAFSYALSIFLQNKGKISH